MMYGYGYGYGYGAGWPVWGIALMWLGMIAVLGLIIWVIYSATAGSSQAPPCVAAAGPARTPGSRAGSWTSGWPAVRSAPMSTRGCGRRWSPGSTWRPAAAGSPS
jgi:hypothetical protein